MLEKIREPIDDNDEVYPCQDCGKLRSKNQGGGKFEICDECYYKRQRKEKLLRYPEVGQFIKHIGKLIKVEIINPPPPPSYEEFIFEEITAKIEVNRFGKIIDKVASFTDWYGLEDSVESAIEEAKEYCKNNRITKDSELEVTVTRIATQIRKRPVGKAEFWSREGYDDNKGWMDFKSTDNPKQNLPEPTETLVWSSKKDEI